MDEIPLSSTVLLDLGISISEDHTEASPLETRRGANLPAIPEHVPGANRLIADALDVAALVDPDPDREAARDRMRTRLVREPNDRTVHIASIEFEGEVKPNGDVHAVGYVLLPKMDKPQRVTPLITVGPEFLRSLGNGKYASAGTFHCLLFRPTNKTGAYKALPLGFASPAAILTWNDVAKRRNDLPSFRNNPWPLIEVIANDLRRPGVRSISFIPTFDPDMDVAPHARRRQSIGTHFGIPLYLASRSQIPEPEVVDGVRRFVKKHRFRVRRLTEKSVEVVWLGPEDDVKILPRLEIEDVQYEMNPFAVLATTALRVDWKNLETTTRSWLNRAYDSKNPLYLAGLELGLVYPADEHHTKRANLEELWKKAIKQVQAQMIQASELIRHKLNIAPNKPSPDQIMGMETSVEAVARFLNKPIDAAAEWIGNALDQPFDPKSPFHMHLRAWFVNTYTREPRRGDLPTRRPDSSQLSVRVPELTPVLQHHTIPQIPLASPPRELSRPEFQPSDAFVPVSVEQPRGDELVVLDEDDLEEVFEAEPTVVDHQIDHDQFPGNDFAPDVPPPQINAKPGSILYMGTYKDAFDPTKK